MSALSTLRTYLFNSCGASARTSITGNQFRFALPPPGNVEDIALMATQFAEEARLINGRALDG
jgi:hypothetical protein